MKLIQMLLFAIAVTACSTPGSGIVEISNNAYMHSKFGSLFTYSGSEVKADLYREASAFCVEKGRKIIPINSTAQDSGLATYASAEIQFRCE